MGAGWRLIVLLALVDDIYDGVLARRWKCDTPAIRLADSGADTVFYLGVAGALWVREPGGLRSNAWPLGVLFALEGLRYGLDFWKFGKGSSYHSYLAKAWGLVMAVAVIGVLSFGGLRWMVRVSILVGVGTNLEGLAMSLMLPRWTHDVKTLGVAWRLRRQMVQSVEWGRELFCREFEWVAEGDAAEGAAVLEVFGEDEGAAGAAGGGPEHGVPEG